MPHPSVQRSLAWHGAVFPVAQALPKREGEPSSWARIGSSYSHGWIQDLEKGVQVRWPIIAYNTTHVCLQLKRN